MSHARPSPCSIPTLLQARRSSTAFTQAEPARAMAQPGDVRRLRRQHPHHRCCACRRCSGEGEAPAGFILAIALWLWFTVLFANFAEALAEGRSKAQAASLRGLKKETWAKKLEAAAPRRASGYPIEPTDLRKGDVVLVEANDVDPARRRGDRRRGLGRRERHHRRIGAGDPRIGRRLLGRHRRHARAVGLDRRARHASTRARPSSTA